MATENKTAVTQLFDIIKGVAQYSDNNPLLNQILMSEKRLLEIEKEQMISCYYGGYKNGQANWGDGSDKTGEDYHNEAYGGGNE